MTRDTSQRMMHCPKCCPKRWENVHGVTGTVLHSYDPFDWEDILGAWGWRCTNCGHHKKPRKHKTLAERFGGLPLTTRIVDVAMMP